MVGRLVFVEEEKKEDRGGTVFEMEDEVDREEMSDKRSASRA